MKGPELVEGLAGEDQALGQAGGEKAVAGAQLVAGEGLSGRGRAGHALPFQKGSLVLRTSLRLAGAALFPKRPLSAATPGVSRVWAGGPYRPAAPAGGMSDERGAS